MTHRVGTFFIFLGLLLIGLFILSDIAQTPTCNLLFFGGLSLVFGIFLWFRDPVQPGPPPERFRLLRSFRKKQEKKK